MLLKSKLIYQHITRPNIIDKFNIADSDNIARICQIRVSCRVDNTNLWAGVGLVEFITGQRAAIRPVRGKNLQIVKDWYDIVVDLRRRNLYVFLDWFLGMTLANFCDRKKIIKKKCSLVLGTLGFSRATTLGSTITITDTKSDGLICIKVSNLIPFLLRVSGRILPKEIVLDVDDFVIEVFVDRGVVGCSSALVTSVLLSALQLL